jgi:hypothetical protein
MREKAVMSGRGSKPKPAKVTIRKLPPDLAQDVFLASFDDACNAMNLPSEQRGLVHYLPGKVRCGRACKCAVIACM